MNYHNAANMIGKLEKLLSNPSAPPSAANVVRIMLDYIAPLLRELAARGAETAEALGTVEGLAQAAFVTSRQTLAGELFTDMAEALLELREALKPLEATGGEAYTTSLALLDRLDGSVAAYEEFLLEGDDEEGEEGEDTAPVVEALAVATEAPPPPTGSVDLPVNSTTP